MGYMQQRYNIFYIIFPMLSLFLSSCSRDENIIPQKTMSAIVAEMYLADKYVEDIPQYRAQMDSLYLYEAVTARYGYTYNDYQTSVKHYLQKGDALKKIHIKAKETLVSRRDHLNSIIAKERGMEIKFWALDSLVKKEFCRLWKEPYLRTVQWLTMYNKIKQPKSWRFTDTTAADMPQNAVWWINNIRLQDAGYIDSIYPPLLKDYTLAKERELEEKKAQENKLHNASNTANRVIPAKQMKKFIPQSRPDGKSFTPKSRPGSNRIPQKPEEKKQNISL